MSFVLSAGSILIFIDIFYHLHSSAENVYTIGRVWEEKTLLVWLYQGSAPKINFGDISVSEQEGSFIVKAPPNHGLMSVVNYLDIEIGDDGCKDFIQFEQSIGLNPIRATHVCGKIDRNTNGMHSKDNLGSRTFLDPEGETRIYTHLKSDSGVESIPYIFAKIVFTAYTDCPRDLSNSRYGRCSSNNSFSCIDRALFCDQRLHCGFEDEFGIDEEQCGTDNILRYTFIGIIFGLSLVYLIYFAIRTTTTKLWAKDQNEDVKSELDDCSREYEYRSNYYTTPTTPEVTPTPYATSFAVLM